MLAGIIRGAVAGAAGTLAMDLLWWRRYRSSGGEDPFPTWERSSATSFDEGGAPAQVGARLASAVGLDVPEEKAGATNTVVHWSTGVSWGVAHSLLPVTGAAATVLAGTVTGVAAFATSYALLGLAGIYDPIWEYGAESLWKDLSAHLVFGTATALAAVALRALPTGD